MHSGLPPALSLPLSLLTSGCVLRAHGSVQQRLSHWCGLTQVSHFEPSNNNKNWFHPAAVYMPKRSGNAAVSAEGLRCELLVHGQVYDDVQLQRQVRKPRYGATVSCEIRHLVWGGGESSTATPTERTIPRRKCSVPRPRYRFPSKWTAARSARYARGNTVSHGATLSWVAITGEEPLSCVTPPAAEGHAGTRAESRARTSSASATLTRRVAGS